MRQIVTTLLISVCAMTQAAELDPILAKSTGSQPALVVFKGELALEKSGNLQGDARTKAVFDSAFARDATLKAQAEAIGRPDAERLWLVNALFLDLNAAQATQLAERADVQAVRASLPHKMQQPIADLQPKQTLAMPYGITKIRANELWALGIRGAGVVIAGADTGYAWEHPALKRSYRGWNGTIVDHNFSWYDGIRDASLGSIVGSTCIQVASNTYACDDGSHGTHTMGTMIGNDLASEQIGVAPDARWIGCRNMNRGNGRPDTYLRCMQWLLAPTDLMGNNPDPNLAPHVVNNSWTCPPSELCTSSEVLRGGVSTLQAAGIMFVASAGNAISLCSSIIDPPALYPETFTVGNTNSGDNMGVFSSFGPALLNGVQLSKPDVVAPGTEVWSSIPPAGYAQFTGTSMASPHVAGAAALLMSAFPSLKRNPEAVARLLRETAVPIVGNTQSCGGILPTFYPNNVAGMGRIDVFAAYQRALATIDAGGFFSGFEF
jgi:serine protease AprX